MKTLLITLSIVLFASCSNYREDVETFQFTTCIHNIYSLQDSTVKGSCNNKGVYTFAKIDQNIYPLKNSSYPFSLLPSTYKIFKKDSCIIITFENSDLNEFIVK